MTEPAKSHGKRAFQSAAHPARHLDIVRYFGQRGARPLQEELPHAREPDSAGCPVEERISEIAFQIADLLA